MGDTNALLASELQAYVQDRLGPIHDLRSLGNTVNAGECTHVTCTFGEGVLKTKVTLVEHRFYEDFAADLRKKGVMSPELYASGIVQPSFQHWILLEYLRDAFPRERWGNDAQQLRLLFRLHHATWRYRRPVVQHHYLPQWTEAMTEATMDWFARSVDATNLRGLLQEARLRFEEVPKEDCCISGDTNPTNWRMREDGELVLLDWERFGYGTPAIDLAVLIPGNGRTDASLEQALAQQYLRHWHKSDLDFAYDEETLVKQILLAKLFTMVEFVAKASLQPDRSPFEIVNFCIQRIPAQVKKIHL